MVHNVVSYEIRAIKDNCLLLLFFGFVPHDNRKLLLSLPTKLLMSPVGCQCFASCLSIQILIKASWYHVEIMTASDCMDCNVIQDNLYLTVKGLVLVINLLLLILEMPNNTVIEQLWFATHAMAESL